MTRAVLAIDQGTSATKALVVGAGRRRARRRRGRRPCRRTAPGGAVEQDPQELLDSVVEAGPRGARRGRRAGGRGRRWPTRARPCCAWDRGTGRPLAAAVVWQDRRAGRSATARRRTPTGSPSSPVCRSTRTSPRRRWPGCASTAPREGVVTTTDAWLVPPAHRRVRHRRRHGVAHAAARPRRGDWSDEACALFGLDRRAAARDRRLRRRRRRDRRAFGARAAGDRARSSTSRPRCSPSAASTPARRSARTAPARSCSPTSATAAGARGAGLAACVAWRLRRRRPTYCLDGQVYTVGSAVALAGRARPHRRRRPTSTASAARRGRRRRDLRPGARRARRAVLGARRARRASSGCRSRRRRAHLVRAVVDGHRRAGRRRWPRRSATTSARRSTRAAGRRRADPLADC